MLIVGTIYLFAKWENMVGGEDKVLCHMLRTRCPHRTLLQAARFPVYLC